MPNVQLTAKEAKTLKVKKSRNGYGVFALKDFSSDKMLFEVTGKLVTCNEDEPIDEVERANTYRLNKNWYLSPKGRLADMLNHSCTPNAKVFKKEGKLYIVSLLPILKDSEVVIDYSTILASDDSWNMHCNCGTDECRKVIKQFTKLPKRLQVLYRSQRIVPRYILTL